VALVTGHENDDKQQPALDYTALATFPGTLVFYMGITKVESWSGALVRGGKSPQTPVAVVRRCSWPDQSTIRTTLGEVAAVIHDQKVRPPVITIVGDVAAAEPVAEWFTERPLFRQLIMVTRPEAQADTLCARLIELGADVIVQPAIQITPPADWAPVDAALARMPDYQWLVFSSANGVKHLLDRVLAHGDVRQLAGVNLAAIGPATAAELARYSLRAQLVPPAYRAEELAQSLADRVSGQRVLLARASRGREVLAEQLRTAGAIVDPVVVYESRDIVQPDMHVREALAAGQVGWVTVTSSAIAKSLAAMFGPDLRRARLASISPITSQTLRELGFQVAAEARQFTTEGLIEAILAP
jgi:uroporphyrinogen III methyltransferase/synthase